MTPKERAELVAEIAEAVGHQPSSVLSDDERRWVRMAIQREAEKAELRRAIITKTLGGLVWAGILGFGYLVADFFNNHGFK